MSVVASKLKHGLGWLPDIPDQRDFLYSVPTAVTKLPDSVDLRPHCPPVYDQGQLGSCTANAIGFHLDFNRKRQGEPFIGPSRLFIYYNERLARHTTKSDSGATIRGSVKAIVKYGACPEQEWPYTLTRFTVRPAKVCYTDALKFEALAYARIERSMTSMKQRLAAGFPFVIGITVYDSFEQIGPDGIMPMPASTEGVLGGHALAVVGYKKINSQDYFIVRNSWGSGWGDQGYLYMPGEYLMDSKLSSDFWTISTVK